MGTVRVPAEDRRQVEATVDGYTYRARGGFFEMDDRHAATHLKAGGFGKSWQVQGVPKPSGGFRCTGCGFGTWFATCGRCGGVCERELS